MAAWLGEYPSALTLLIKDVLQLAKDVYQKKVNFEDAMLRGNYIIKQVVSLLVEMFQAKDKPVKETPMINKTPITSGQPTVKT